MSNSKLVSYKKISPNKNSPRNHKIDTISIHCTSGNMNNTAKQIADFKHFTTAGLSNSCSCNYAVGGDGSIALIVDESDRSWCTSSPSNDHRAVTIEVASTNVEPYKVTDKALEALIELVADICQRNGIKELKWQGDKSLIGQVEKQNMTVHRWFKNKACPGDYLYNLHSDIAKKVNEKLNRGEDMLEKRKFNIDGEVKEIECYVSKGVTFVPIRVVAESLDFSVDYNETSQVTTIYPQK